MWPARANPAIPKHEDNTYASETPVTDGERIVVYFGMTGVYCYDFNGELLWSKDLGAYPMDGDWGTSSSPAMHDGLVFIQVDNEEKSFLVALDAKTGDERWRLARDEKSNWGSPVVWKNSHRTELVTSGKVVRSYNPQNGEQLWELNIGGGRSCSSPSTLRRSAPGWPRRSFRPRAKVLADYLPSRRVSRATLRLPEGETRATA